MLSSLKAVLLLILIQFACQFESDAQQDVTIENLIENIGGETFSSPEIDIIEYYREYPINLRNTDADELSKLPGISIIAAKEIIKIVTENPEIKNYKIADLIGLSPEAEIILDNCTVNIPFNQEKVRQGFILRSRYNQHFEDVKGFTDNKYLGSKTDLYNRLVGFYSDFEAGGVINKNAGEPDFNQFSSGYVRFDNGRTKVIAGDFYADYGMGSLLWRQFSSRKGSEVISPVANIGSGISPYRSSIDFAYFRGVSAQTLLSISNDVNMRLSGFYSNRDKSATIDSASMEISSIYSAGYYRTETELDKRNNLNEKAIGGNIEFNASGWLTFGANVLALDYSLPINSSSSSAFSGKSGQLFSAYSSYKFSSNLIGAEFSVDALSNNMITAGFIHSAGLIDFAVSARYIEKEFRSPYGFHFGENSSPANEKGFYTGVQLKLSNQLNISFFADIFSTLGSTYTVPAIVHGMDLFAEGNYKPDKYSALTLRIRRDEKTDAFTDSESLRFVGDGIKQSVRLEYARNIGKDWTVRMRTEYLNYTNEFNIDCGEGALAFFDLRWKAAENLQFGGRYTIFSTDNFNSAIYQYEYTMPGIMQTSALYGHGGRIIFSASYSLNEYLKINANYFETYKNNTDKLGSGYEQIDSNSDHRGAIQIEFKMK